jgi:uncharacterized protein YbjT (DUF2867 family)
MGRSVQPILVTGATGVLGRQIICRLLAAGYRVRALSRRPPEGRAVPGSADWVTGDLVIGAGVHQAVQDVGVIIHCASDFRHPRLDVDMAQNLISAAAGRGASAGNEVSAAGVTGAERRAATGATASPGPHLAYISIVGADRIPLRYYQAKVDVERLVENSGLPWTILRATQFHDLISYLSQQAARLPVMMVPAGTSFQPVDAGEVADRLVELALGKPAGRAPDMGGPAVRTVADLARAYLRATRQRRPVLPVRVPGKIFSGYRHGAHLAPDRAGGCRTYEEFLVGQVSPARRPLRYGAAGQAGRP